jgi:hypothetical protein
MGGHVRFRDLSKKEEAANAGPVVTRIVAGRTGGLSEPW